MIQDYLLYQPNILQLSQAPSSASCRMRSCPTCKAEAERGSGRAAGLHTPHCADLLPPCSFGNREPSSPATVLQLCVPQPFLQWLKLSQSLKLLYPSAGKTLLIGLDIGQNPWKPVAASVMSSAS